MNGSEELRGLARDLVVASGVLACWVLLFAAGCGLRVLERLRLVAELPK